jgi:hypothetical protein
MYTAVVPAFTPVERFLGSEGMSVTLTRRGALKELQIYPSGGTRATWRQQQEVDRRIDEWSEAVASYLGAAIDLYQYLEGHPNRAVPCLSHVFDQHGAESGPLTDLEAEMVDRVKGTTQEVAEILLVEPGEAHSLNELSRLVFDPFPTRLTIRVDGPVVSTEALAVSDGVAERLPVDLWRALASMEGRWIYPDLVTAMVSPVPEDRQPDIDVADFARRTRRFGAAPQPYEVAETLRSSLVPPSVHILRWRSTSAGQPDFDNTDPRRFIEAAEAALPR